MSSCTHTAPVGDLAARWPVVPARAWVSGHKLSVVLPDEQGSQRYEASWNEAGLDEHGYRLRVAELLPTDRKPGRNRMPSRARPATVLGPGSWQHFSFALAERLTPDRPGTATQLRVGSREVLLLRGERGTIRTVPLRQAPADIRIVARRNVVELANEATRFAEMEAARAGVDTGVFLFVVPPRNSRGGLLLFDLSEKLCVAATLPRPPQPREGSAVERQARTAEALVVESHALAVLKNPVSSVGRLVNIFFQWIATWTSRGLPSIDEPAPPLAHAAPMDLAAWERELDRRTGEVASRGSIRLLIDGERYFPVLEQRIRQAQTSIEIRVNIFDTDDVAVRVADLLRAASQRVSVRVIMDQMSTIGGGNLPPASTMPAEYVMPSSMWRYLEHDSRVAARAFLNPWMSSDHSKVFLFDRRFAHLGGMNIGREYRYEWHDMMVELEGPIVARFARDFERSWAFQSALGDLAYVVAAGSSPPGFVGEPERPDYVNVRPLYTNTGTRQIYEALLAAASRARSYLWVENPYLYENSFVTALVAARRRGVDVRVVLPSDSDLGLGDSSNMVTANILIANGVRVFVYPGMTHVKAAVIDGWACLGSANFNKLSFRRNIETNIATSDPRFVGELNHQLFEHDFAVSSELSQPVTVTGSDRFAQWVMDQF